jgi:hypothetical protein
MEPQKYIVTVDQLGTEWRNEAGKLHRLDGPAIEYTDGSKSWWVNGKRHRLDGPAVERKNGDKEWHVNDKLHRLDGPAIEWWDGTKSWWVNGKRHRIDGAAIEWSDGDKEWWIEGTEYTEKQFNKKKELNNQIKKTITNEYYELTIIKLSTEQITDIRDEFSYISYVSLIHFDVIYGIDYKTNEIKILKNRYDIESYYKFQGVDCLFNYETELQIKWQTHNARVLKIIKL